MSCFAEESAVVTFREVLQELLELPGATYSCVADRTAGRLLDEAGTSSVAPGAVMELGGSAAGFLAFVAGDGLDDLMITSLRSYHLVRPVLGDPRQQLMIYLCLDRGRSNLAAARRELAAPSLHKRLASATTGPPGSAHRSAHRVAGRTAAGRRYRSSVITPAGDVTRHDAALGEPGTGTGTGTGTGGAGGHPGETGPGVTPPGGAARPGDRTPGPDRAVTGPVRPAGCRPGSPAAAAAVRSVPGATPAAGGAGRAPGDRAGLGHRCRHHAPVVDGSPVPSLMKYTRMAAAPSPSVFPARLGPSLSCRPEPLGYASGSPNERPLERTPRARTSPRWRSRK
jgi:hypothetical protein